LKESPGGVGSQGRWSATSGRPPENVGVGSRPRSRSGVFPCGATVSQHEFPVLMEKNVKRWKVSWSGLCDRRAVEATLVDLGGWHEHGSWYVPAKFKYPSYICQRLAAHFYGGGEYNISLTAV